jgi:hypothetical protein
LVKKKIIVHFLAYISNKIKIYKFNAGKCKKKTEKSYEKKKKKTIWAWS